MSPIKSLPPAAGGPATICATRAQTIADQANANGQPTPVPQTEGMTFAALRSIGGYKKKKLKRKRRKTMKKRRKPKRKRRKTRRKTMKKRRRKRKRRSTKKRR